MTNLTHVFYAKSLRDITYTTDPQTLEAAQYQYMITLTDETVEPHGLFRVMNVVDGDPDIEVPVRIRCRSMSVGDVYVKDGSAFYCAPAGWTKITNQAFIDSLLAMCREPSVLG